ncbi:MAG TPA: hypothetical protein VH044_02205 [Polyangiaceae bacterium]|nr:hypothetical protein [Polyangiaceae bacterium]
MSSTRAIALERTVIDAQEVEGLRARSPRTVDALERGEALAIVGSLEEAHHVFEQAESENRDASIVWRRDCEVLAVLGQRDAATEACNMATQNRRSDLNLRATIRALGSGPEAPKPMELFVALTLAQERIHRGNADAVIMGAECELAESVGDAHMLEQCTNALRAIAPEQPTTRRLLGRLAAMCPPWRFWLGWGAIAVAVAATLAHLVSRRRRAMPGGGGRSAAVVAAGLLAWTALSFCAGAARADDDPPDTVGRLAPGAGLSKWPVNDEDPASSIPSEKDRNAEPLQFGYWIQDLVSKAEHAAKHGDHKAAAKYWAALTVAVPDRAVSFEKLCEEYSAMGDHDQAIDACGQALLRDGLTVADYARFVHVVLDKPGPLAPKEITALGNVLDHMKTEDAGKDVANELECEVGVRTSNLKQLKECTAALAATAPDDPKTISFRWALAVQEDKYSDARTLIEQAKTKGIGPDSIESMQRVTDDGASHYRKRIMLWLVFAALALAGGVAATRALGSRRRAPQPA